MWSLANLHIFSEINVVLGRIRNGLPKKKVLVEQVKMFRASHHPLTKASG
jgi:hypothetical protein